MAVTTSDKAVTDYLNNLLNDLTLDSVSIAPPSSTPSDDADFTFAPADSVDVTSRMVPLVDPFRLMALQDNRGNQNLLWLGIHGLLPLCMHLPDSAIKQYCLRQCQTLMHKAQCNTA